MTQGARVRVRVAIKAMSLIDMVVGGGSWKFLKEFVNNFET